MTNPLDHQPVIDHFQFDEMRNLLDEDFKDLMRDYIHDSKERILSLREALTQGDNATGFDIAHTLKGASANIGATGLVEHCHLLQEACRAKKIVDQCPLIDQIEDELNLVHNDIKQRLGIK